MLRHERDPSDGCVNRARDSTSTHQAPDMGKPFSRRSVLTSAAAVASTDLPSRAAAQTSPDKNQPIRGIAPASSQEP